MPKIQITKEEIIRHYNNGMSLIDISKLANCHFTNISSHLRRLSVSPRRAINRTYHYDTTFFDEINSEEKAYILGFLYADGYNQQTKNLIRITLHKKDEDVLHKIKDAMKYDKDLMMIKDTYLDLSFNCILLSNRLASLGCIQKKTFTIRFPYNHIPEMYYRDFIRGYFDGDGCINIAKSKKDFQLNLYGNCIFIPEVANIIFKNCDLPPRKIHNKGNSCFFTVHGKKGCIKVLDYLYSNSNIYMDRKYKLYQEIVSL